MLQIERGESPGSKNVQGAILYSDALEKIIPDFREDAPLERHIIEQRMWMLDDDSFVGTTYRSRCVQQAAVQSLHDHPRAVRQVVLAQVRDAGALLICETTVTGLLMDGKRVIGVQTRPRGRLRVRRCRDSG